MQFLKNHEISMLKLNPGELKTIELISVTFHAAILLI